MERPSDEELLATARRTGRWEDISALADMAEDAGIKKAIHEIAWLKSKRD